MTKSNAKTKSERASRASESRRPAPEPVRNAKAATKSKPHATKGRDSDWREETLARIRALIREADPEITEERKWIKPTNPSGIPVWSHPGGGIVCTGEMYKNAVKLTFPRGASLPDPSRLFNSSLEGNRRRAIDIHEGQSADARWRAAFKALVKAAAAQNGAPADKSRPGAKPGAKPRLRQATPTKPQKNEKVVLLSGGNPQIAKADGDAPVQAYIAAMSGGGPGWKRDLGKRLDALIERTVPNVRKAVKWNSPFYGIDGGGQAGAGSKQGWFLSFHVFTRYIKVTFFRGTSLRPVPPGGTPKSKDVRWIDIHDGEWGRELETQLATWVKQAAALPGWVP